MCRYLDRLREREGFIDRNIPKEIMKSSSIHIKAPRQKTSKKIHIHILAYPLPSIQVLYMTSTDIHINQTQGYTQTHTYHIHTHTHTFMLTSHLHPLSFTVEDSNTLDLSDVLCRAQKRRRKIQGGWSYPFLDHRPGKEKPSPTEMMRLWNTWKRARRCCLRFRGQSNGGCIRRLLPSKNCWGLNRKQRNKDSRLCSCNSSPVTRWFCSLWTMVNSQHHSSQVPSWNTTTPPTTSRAWSKHPSQAYQQPQPAVEQPVIPPCPPALPYPHHTLPPPSKMFTAFHPSYVTLTNNYTHCRLVLAMWSTCFRGASWFCSECLFIVWGVSYFLRFEMKVVICFFS